MTQLIPIERVENRILSIRGQRVMLDRDLAEMYGVETGNLNKAVSRNIERFPNDFMFVLTTDELAQLREQFPNDLWAMVRFPPRAFTEQGVAMLSTVLRSEQAIEVNILIMRAFVKMREMLTTHKDLIKQLEALEKKYDKQFAIVFDAIRQLMAPPPATPAKKFGFRRESDEDTKSVKVRMKKSG
jgi:hypothetical protein